MDYLFYGKVTTSRRGESTTISLNIRCEQDEVLILHELSSRVSRQLIYEPIPIKRDAESITAIFDVQDNQLFLFTISGQSNEIDIPFEVTYVVYNGEVISLPENNVIQLDGSIYLFHNGERKML
jgi:hypothetical protein